MTEFHFLRPLWLLMLLPLLLVAGLLLRQGSLSSAWNNVCDEHLLPFLIHMKGRSRRSFSLVLLLLSGLFMVISLAGPTWSRLPVPTYHPIQPRVVVLDMSTAMLEKDLTPDRLSRAKFKLHDLFQHQEAGQFALVVYTGEPFVVSPLTEDGQTIDALLSSLTTDIMPVEGQELSEALRQAEKLITQAGFNYGQVLVLAASTPSPAAIAAAKTLAQSGIHTSIIPLSNHNASPNPLFQQLAKAGQGKLIPYSDTSADIEQWLSATSGEHQYAANLQNEMPVWRDQGRWFLIPALLFLLPVFQRGWLQRINT